MCKVYSICNQKGGCGKSNVSVNLAATLVKEGQRVLVVDADPQGSATVSLGFENPEVFCCCVRSSLCILDVNLI